MARNVKYDVHAQSQHTVHESPWLLHTRNLGRVHASQLIGKLRASGFKAHCVEAGKSFKP